MEGWELARAKAQSLGEKPVCVQSGWTEMHFGAKLPQVSNDTAGITTNHSYSMKEPTFCTQLSSCT